MGTQITARNEVPDNLSGYGCTTEYSPAAGDGNNAED